MVFIIDWVHLFFYFLSHKKSFSPLALSLVKDPFNLSISFRLNLQFYKFLSFLALCLSWIFYIFLLFFIILIEASSKPYYMAYTFNTIYIYPLTLMIDNLSLLFLLLTTLLSPICILLSIYQPLQTNFSQPLGITDLGYKFFNTSDLSILCIFKVSQLLIIFLFLLLELILLLLFTSTDFFIFYVLFELSMIPIYFMIGFSGSQINRIRASYYIFFYTLLSSISFLIGLLFLKYNYGTTNLQLLLECFFTSNLQITLWFLFFIPIAVKIPMVPLHIWLPEAHVEAPTEGSVFLAGLMLKIGFFGLIRFLLPLFPEGTLYFTPLILTLALISVIYTSLIIFQQTDMKKLIAYSSIAHMNFSLLGLFSGTLQGLYGCIFLLYTHGLISSALFITVGSLYSRYHTRSVLHYGGMCSQYPVLSFFFFLFLLGNFSFPGTGGFIGEILIILGLFQKNITIGLLSLIGPFLCAIYSLHLFVRIFFGVAQGSSGTQRMHYRKGLIILNYTEPFYSQVTSLEFSIYFFLTTQIVLSGFFPSLFLGLIKMSTVFLFYYI